MSLKILQKLKTDFDFYSSHNLKIRTKEGDILPFVMNKAQRYIHERIEEQRAETGKVRAIILKGRQQGASTYIGGRFYWRVSFLKGRQVFILTHEDSATQNLFKMAQRYHEHSKAKPSTSASNAKELVFDKLESGYKVGTAGNKGVGRSSTIQFFHGSEVAFWPHADEHAKGIIQAIPDAIGTEVVLESTANGLGNYYHQQWKAAEAGQSDFIAIFVPWYWQDEYVKTLPPDFVLSEEEEELKEQYNLTDEQIYWRRRKIVDLSAGGVDGEKAFKQEYPMNAAEAFQMSGGDGLIRADSVERARKTQIVMKPKLNLAVGVDPSRGGDRFSVIRRRGRKAYNLQNYTDDQVDKLGKAVAICVKILKEEKPHTMFVDAGGGADLVDRLHELGHYNVKAINFGSSPLDEEKYKNKRAEMWGEMAEWLNDENLPVDIPDSDELHADLLASPYERDSHDRIQLWVKKKIKKEYGFSPDSGDALALTFAEPMADHQWSDNDYNTSGIV